ncbi:unnamed protein product [Rhodiola kirilowii]
MPALPLVALSIPSLGKYLTLNILLTSKFGFVKTLHPCLANIATFISSTSLKPSYPIPFSLCLFRFQAVDSLILGTVPPEFYNISISLLHKETEILKHNTA